jgi:hypothetical protein
MVFMQVHNDAQLVFFKIEGPSQQRNVCLYKERIRIGKGQKSIILALASFTPIEESAENGKQFLSNSEEIHSSLCLGTRLHKFV